MQKQGKRVKPKLINEEKNIYRVDLSNLQSEKLYIYQAGSKEMGWSPVYSFIGPSKTEARYPLLAVLGELSLSSKESYSVLSELIARVIPIQSFIERLDGIFLFEELEDHPLYDTIRSNIPVMNTANSIEDPYYSIRYYNTYVISMNTFTIDEDQLNWLNKELKHSKQYYWTIVIGHHSLNYINTYYNFTKIFTNYHVNIYLHQGSFFFTNIIKYPINENGHSHFQETSEILIVQQGPSWISNKNRELSNSTIYANKAPAYGLITPRYSSLMYQEFSSSNHLLLNENLLYRIDVYSRKTTDIKDFKITFALTFAIFLCAILQVLAKKELEKRRLNSQISIEGGIIE